MSSSPIQPAPSTMTAHLDPELLLLIAKHVKRSFPVHDGSFPSIEKTINAEQDILRNLILTSKVSIPHVFLVSTDNLGHVRALCTFSLQRLYPLRLCRFRCRLEDQREQRSNPWRRMKHDPAILSRLKTVSLGDLTNFSWKPTGFKETQRLLIESKGDDYKNIRTYHTF